MRGQQLAATGDIALTCMQQERRELKGVVLGEVGLVMQRRREGRELGQE